MHRIVILGCSGTGKSTLARKVGARLNLPVIHLDSLFWEPGWVEAETEVFRARVIDAISGGRWVTDGNYLTKTGDLRFGDADLILWIDQPRWLRLVRIIRRTVSQLGRSRQDLAEGCPERLDLAFIEFLRWVWDFDQVTRPRIEAGLESICPGKPVLHLKGDRAIAAWLESLSP